MRKNSHQVTSAPSHQCKSLAVFAVTFLLLTFAGCAKREIANIGSKGTNIICFGDSITWGYGVTPGQDYPSVLGQLTGIPVINSGLDGDTSVSALQRLDSDVLKRDPVLVIIEFGGNDFLRKIPLEETVKNVEAMIKEVQGKGAMVAVADIHTGFIMTDYARAFKRLAREHNAIFLKNILSGIITNPQLKSDFLHPNSDGYKLIAQRIYYLILPYLKPHTKVNKSAGEGT